MAQQKGAAPPPAYGSDISSPQPAHVGPLSHQGSDYYGASQYQSPPPGAQGYPPPQSNYAMQNSNGYYAPGPQMGYQQQPYGPPQGYYGQQQQQYPQQGYGPQYGPQGYYGPQQGGYYDNRNGSSGMMGGLLGALACCCCLDACLLF